MFKYNMSGSMHSIRAKSALPDAVPTGWPNLIDMDLGMLANELDLVAAASMRIAPTTAEAKEVARNWMERQGLSAVDLGAEKRRSVASESEENKGGAPVRPRGPSLYRR